jgi:hypothetical protein
MLQRFVRKIVENINKEKANLCLVLFMFSIELKSFFRNLSFLISAKALYSMNFQRFVVSEI